MTILLPSLLFFLSLNSTSIFVIHFGEEIPIFSFFPIHIFDENSVQEWAGLRFAKRDGLWGTLTCMPIMVAMGMNANHLLYII